MDKNATVTLHTGNRMPVLGLGTWQLTKETASTIAQAFELGYRMIDTSGDYGTQPGIGQGITQSGIARDMFYLVTKVEETDDAYEATRQDLAELQLDQANLMLIHRPPATGAGEDLWRGLIRAKNEGLTVDIGVSNYSVEKIQALIDATGEVPVVNQIEWSPFGHSLEMLEYCRAQDIIIQAYSPLTHAKQLGQDTLDEIGGHYGKTAAQVLIRWNIQLGVVPIVKANRLDHLKENIDVFDFIMNEDDMATLNGLNEHYSALSSRPNIL